MMTSRFKKFISILYIYISLSLLTLITTYKIDSTKSFIRLEDGRYAIFHGVNVVVKLPPYIPDTSKFDPYTSFTDEDIATLKYLGINLVRLGIIWESIERQEGTYDLDHLEKMSEIVSKLEKNGITVMIDAHQDMFSRTFCGEGAPKFYVDKMSYQTKCDKNLLSRFFGLVTACLPLSKYSWDYDENDLPLIKDCVGKGSFIDYHKSPELMSIYESFFNNENGSLDAFIEFWKILANKFKNRSNVLGYDLWNEPWAPSLWSSINSLIPGYVDNHQLIDFYSKINSGIEQVDPNYMMFFQPIPFPDTFPLFGGHALGTFTSPPVDVEKRPQVFNVHTYCCASDQNMCKDGEPKLEDAKTKCADFHERKTKKNKEQALNIGMPLIVTEFGACSSSMACYYEMLGFEKVADKYLISWAYWMFKAFNDHTTTAAENEEGIFNSDGSLQNIKERALSRSYVQYWQGYPVDMDFNDDSKVLKASFKFDKNITEPTVIYYNKKLNYKNGYNLVVTNEEGTVLDNIVVEEKEIGYINVKINSQDTDWIVKITLTPK